MKGHNNVVIKGGSALKSYIEPKSESPISWD
jgi:hypothetical protein